MSFFKNWSIGQKIAIVAVIVLIISEFFLVYQIHHIEEPEFNNKISGIIENKISNFQSMVSLYAMKNGEHYSNLSVAKLQADNIITDSNWHVIKGWAYPINNSVIQGYAIIPKYSYFGSLYGIGFKDDKLTYNQAYLICKHFENHINAVSFGKKWYPINWKNKCGEIIPKKNSFIHSGEMFLSFE